jgi:hypothetical protein
LFGSVFGRVGWVFAVGYVICRGVTGYVMVGWLCGLGLHVGCSCMAGNMAKDICGS